MSISLFNFVNFLVIYTFNHPGGWFFLFHKTLKEEIMKKLFSMASVFLLILGLAGCNLNAKEEDLELRQQQIDELQDEIMAIMYSSDFAVGGNVNLEEMRESLDRQIKELQELTFDNVLTVTLTYWDDSIGIKTIGFDDDFQGNLFDLLEMNYTIEYDETDYGIYLKSIHGLNPIEGAFIQLSKNGEPASVGVDSITFDDDDVFSFEVVWWDPVQEAVDAAIKLFLLNQADNYVNSETIDYNVFLALNLLDENLHISDSEVETLVTSNSITTVNDYFKAIMILKSRGFNTYILVEELNSMVTVGPYGQTAYGLLALDSYSYMYDYSAYLSAALTDLSTTTPFNLGLDAGAVSIMALSSHITEPGVQDLIDEFTTWISTSQLDSGGVKTRDIVWGDTTYPGTENASSIAQVILGLLANGINPTGPDFTKLDNNLITSLLSFQTETGSFDWAKNDEYTEDLAFSTPQAFLALVAYQVYSNTYTAVNPYNFK